MESVDRRALRRNPPRKSPQGCAEIPELSRINGSDPEGNPRGIRLKSGDEIYFGRACLRFDLHQQVPSGGWDLFPEPLQK